MQGEKITMNEMTLKAENQIVGVPKMEFTRDQVELVKRTVAKGTTDDELALFLYTCKRTGLDPLAKQIHCVKRNGKNGPQATHQVSIDGYRMIADRTGKYAGNDDPIYKEGKEHPDSASVTVYKIVQGQKVGFTATARWAEYFPGEAQGFMWKKMPYLMLGKCAESLALRKAFPSELSGVYTDDEMTQDDTTPITEHKVSVKHTAPTATVVVEAETVSAPVKEYTHESVKSDPVASGSPDLSQSTVKCIPQRVVVKEGTNKNGNPWTKFGILLPDGNTWIGTFDKDMGGLALDAAENKYQINITYKLDGEYKTAVSIEKFKAI